MTRQPDILRRILDTKAVEIEVGRRHTPLVELRARLEDAPPARHFHEAMRVQLDAGGAAVIAEIKRASPSRGLLRRDFDVERLAGGYERGGATCLSVLTDREYFLGGAENLGLARSACRLPVLRKDFLIDPWQIYESRVLGADCVLLIVAVLDDAQLADLASLAEDLGMDVLVEAHDADELERALRLPARLIGINNRDLHTFETRLETTLNLRTQVPDDRILVTESGIASHDDVRRMRKAGVHAFLVGESLMRQPDPGRALAELFIL
ncbi:MAG: indole-3-glycerol phosphate synthase TrpC [Gammaproteobacteria bacterium]|jgi:indole-3-glycerol phosphate synthase